MEINKLIEFFQEEENITRAAKRFAQEQGIEYTDSFRRKCSNLLNLADVKTIDTHTKSNQYENGKEVVEDDFFMPSAWDSENNRFLSVDEYCDKYNLPKELVRSSKLIAHNGSHMIYNMVFGAVTLEDVGIDEEFYTDIIKKHISPVKVERVQKSSDSEYVDRAIITDIHIAMDTDGGTNVVGLYDNPWNAVEVFNRLEVLVQNIIKFKKGDELIIDELGDFLDGLGGKTTRKGHDLPQNMSDKEAFEVGVAFKVSLVERLLPYYEKITCNNITSDNHSGLFSYFVNSTVQKILQEKYSSEGVVYNVLERFINHYSVGSHTFILCHGKDEEALKFGFKPILDAKQSEKIDQYCKEHKLYNGNRIEFSKGDSHLAVFDYTTSNDFEYCSYPAFSPPSNWVKTNFKNSKSGFVIQNVDVKNKNKIVIPIWF